MAQAARVKVPFNTANAAKCNCPICPVQKNSECPTRKMASIDEALKKKTLRRTDIPAVYCSTGIASCGDLDQDKACICPKCPVYAEYKLGGSNPLERYCNQGASM